MGFVRLVNAIHALIEHSKNFRRDQLSNKKLSYNKILGGGFHWEL